MQRRAADQRRRMEEQHVGGAGKARARSPMRIRRRQYHAARAHDRGEEEDERERHRAVLCLRRRVGKAARLRAACPRVIASEAKQSRATYTVPAALDCFVASAFALRASADSKPAVARAASEGGSLLAMTK